MIYHSLVPRPHPAFRHLQYVQDVPESWAGPGNEARFIMGGGEPERACTADLRKCIGVGTRGAPEASLVPRPLFPPTTWPGYEASAPPPPPPPKSFQSVPYMFCTTK